ncbi:MAG: GNAT family N-acetyltransferase [Anaerolineae bacterium]|nr:GNAT family N-acetyltransferase [Anaerolineae bacterium]
MTALNVRTLELKEYKHFERLRQNETPWPYVTDAFTYIWDLAYEIVPRAMLTVEFENQWAGSAGYALVENDPDLAFLGIMIKPEYRRQGLGQEAYTKLIDRLRTRKIRRVLTIVNTWQEAGHEFVTQHDFHEIGRTIYCELDTTAVDLGAWANPDEIVTGQNLRFSTLNRFPRRGLADRLLPIWNRTRPDQPQHWPYVPVSANRFEREVLAPEAISWEHSFALITAENQIVGLNLNIPTAENQLFTFYTGIDPDFRGKKLGLALKLKLIEHAQSQGFAGLAAENDAGNTAMWRINNQLGFMSILEMVTYQKLLEA